MQIHVIHDCAVSQSRESTCAYPLTAVAVDGSLVCMYRRGREKHSYDGVLISQRSTDQGQTWSPPVTVFEGQELSPPQAIESGGICRCGDGSLLIVLCATEVTRPDHYVFSEEGSSQRTRHVTVRSEDHGISWLAPEYLDDQLLRRPLGPTSNPLLLNKDVVFIPGERHHGAGQLGICASFSHDHGRTLEPVQDLILDAAGTVSYCDARFTMFDDGQILGLLWTFRQQDEETLEIHRSVSDDQGRSWTMPQSAGYLGQITDPLAMEGDTVLAASNYRWPPQGIRLWLSRDRGITWSVDESIQMWDADQKRVLAQPLNVTARSDNEGVWNALPSFTFGTPNLKRMSDGTVLLTYYAETEEGKADVRACRFQVEY